MYDEDYNKSLSCSLTPFTIQEQQQIDQAKGKVNILEQEAASMGVSVEQMIQFRTYAAKLLKNSPKMKKERVMRKTAEHFKVKLT